MNSAKRGVIATSMLVMTVILFTGFAPKPKEYTINTDASSATWIGRSVAGQHSGTVYISSGELLVDNGKISRGTVRVDVNSLAVTSISNLKLNSQLTGRLKGKDFFDTYNHPVAIFRISSVRHESGSNYTVNGSLTIKGKTQSVRFPAIINHDKKQISVHATVMVDRTKFNITSGSTDFFNDLGDTAIHNEFEFTLHLVARRS
jgi:polyisoprenoid-binding protein YceI